MKKRIAISLLITLAGALSVLGLCWLIEHFPVMLIVFQTLSITLILLYFFLMTYSFLKNNDK